MAICIAAIAQAVVDIAIVMGTIVTVSKVAISIVVGLVIVSIAVGLAIVSIVVVVIDPDTFADQVVIETSLKSFNIINLILFFLREIKVIHLRFYLFLKYH